MLDKKIEVSFMKKVYICYVLQHNLLIKSRKKFAWCPLNFVCEKLRTSGFSSLTVYFSNLFLWYYVPFSLSICNRLSVTNESRKKSRECFAVSTEIKKMAEDSLS